jgi:hypothetical protein
VRPFRRIHLDATQAGLGILLLGSLAVRLPFWRDTLHDDAFISLRYARALATGQGLTFNPGERVEGFTNFLWTVGLGALVRLHADPVVLLPWLSLLPALATIVAVQRFGARWGGLPSPVWSLGAATLVAAHPFWLAESVGGLETTFFVWVVFAAFARGVAELRGAARPGGAAAGFAIATLVRPEGALLFGIWMAWRGRRGGRAGWWRDAGLYALLVLPCVVFRAVYYHDWVPNTFHAKVGSSWAQVQRGVRYAVEYAAAVTPLPLAAVALWEARRGGWRFAAAALAGLYVLYVVAVGGDFAPTGRFALLPIPFVALLVQSAIVPAVGRSRRAHAAALAAGLIAACGLASGALEIHRLAARHWPGSYRSDLAARRYLGRWLDASLAPEARIAVGSIGAIGWYCPRRILDTFGLTNAAVGRARVEWMGQASAGHEKGDAAAILALEPEIIVFDRAFLAPRPLALDEFLAAARSPFEQLLVEDPRLYAQYGLRTLPSPAGVLHYLERAPAAP